MSSFLPTPGLGFMMTPNNELTLKFNPETHAEKLSDGVYIPKDGFGNGLDGVLDNWTIIPIQSSSEHTMINANYDVVTCIYTMSAYKVTNRSSVKTYQTSNVVKTVDDVMDEFNCAMDAYRALGQDAPDSFFTSLPSTSYIMRKGDFFQFRRYAMPWSAYNAEQNLGWLCAMDDMNRYEGQEILALFYVDDIEYNDPSMSKYMTKLSLKCVWTTLNEFTVGQTYTAEK